MITDARQCSHALRIRIHACRIGGERYGDHMFTHAPVFERRARAVAANPVATTGKFGTVVFRTLDLRQDAPRLDSEELDLAAAIVNLAAREHLLARNLPQRVDVKARPMLGFMGFHERPKQPG